MFGAFLYGIHCFGHLKVSNAKPMMKKTQTSKKIIVILMLFILRNATLENKNVRMKQSV